jgi:lysozyme
MRIKPIYLALGGVALLLLIPAGGALLAEPDASQYLSIADNFIPQWEGFSATPYWDVSRYSWGYGTAAPGSTGTISKADALTAMNNVINSSYQFLNPLITVPLNGNQWGALLSFDYNLGEGDAENLLSNINSGNNAALGTQWLQYVNAGGAVDQDLVNRRNAEWNLWNS